MEEKRTIACQLSYLPVNSENLSSEVAEALSIIRQYFPNAKVGEFSTVVKGSITSILEMVNDLVQKVDVPGNTFNIQISISNICGCSIN